MAQAFQANTTAATAVSASTVTRQVVLANLGPNPIYWSTDATWTPHHVHREPVITLAPGDVKTVCGSDRGGLTPVVAGTGDPSTGSIEAWCDPISSGVMAQIVSHTVCATMETPPSGEATSQTRMGIYRNGIITGSTWAAYYGYTVALDRSAAESIAFTGKLV